MLGMDRAAAMSEFGVVCGMTLPMLALPTVFLGALNLVLVPRLAYSTALDRPEEVRRRAGRAMLAVSVLILPSMALMVVLGPDLARVMFGQPSAGEHLLPLAAAMALGASVAYYLIFLMIAWLFALLVYYTVKLM